MKEKGVYGDLLAISDNPIHAPKSIATIAPTLPNNTLKNQSIAAPNRPPPAPILAMVKLFSHGILMSCHKAQPNTNSTHKPHIGLGKGSPVFIILVRDVRTTRKQRNIVRSPARAAVFRATHIVRLRAQLCPVGLDVDIPWAVTSSTPKTHRAIQGHLLAFRSLPLLFADWVLAGLTSLILQITLTTSS